MTHTQWVQRLRDDLQEASGNALSEHPICPGCKCPVPVSKWAIHAKFCQWPTPSEIMDQMANDARPVT